jgi:hypothetical protein
MKEDIMNIIEYYFSESPTKFIDNFDDVNCGFEIGPDIGEMIRIKWSLDKKDGEFPDFLILESYVMIPHNIELRHKKIYAGAVPTTPDGTIDVDFLGKLLMKRTLLG